MKSIALAACLFLFLVAIPVPEQATIILLGCALVGILSRFLVRVFDSIGG